MIYLLEVENFLSIRDRQVVDLRVSGKVEDPFGRFPPVFPSSGVRAPKVVGLYGANASGKTTVIRALNFILLFVRNQGIQALAGNTVECFNDQASADRPIRFAIEFGGLMDPTPEAVQRYENDEPVEFGVFRYELEITMEAGLVMHIARESLRQRPNDRGKWRRIFDREGQIALGSKAFPIAGFEHLLTTLDPYGSIISNFAHFRHPGAMFFKGLADTAITILDYQPNTNDDGMINFLGSRPELLSSLNSDLKRIDLGIEEMRIETTPAGMLAKFRHSNLDAEMTWSRESNGTRAFIRVYPALLHSLENGGIAIIDELDHAIHPHALPEIIRWFHDPGRNPHDAQLWFSGHAVSLLDELTPEEVLFCEKDRRGRTKLYLAQDVARRDENLRRKYLSGVYGAVPQIG